MQTSENTTKAPAMAGGPVAVTKPSMDIPAQKEDAPALTGIHAVDAINGGYPVVLSTEQGVHVHADGSIHVDDVGKHVQNLERRVTELQAAFLQKVDQLTESREMANSFMADIRNEIAHCDKDNLAQLFSNAKLLHDAWKEAKDKMQYMDSLDVAREEVQTQELVPMFEGPPELNPESFVGQSLILKTGEPRFIVPLTAPLDAPLPPVQGGGQSGASRDDPTHGFAVSNEGSASPYGGTSRSFSPSTRSTRSSSSAGSSRSSLSSRSSRSTGSTKSSARSTGSYWSSISSSGTSASSASTASSRGTPRTVSTHSGGRRPGSKVENRRLTTTHRSSTPYYPKKK